MGFSKNDLLFYLGLVCAVWFVFLGTVWAYCAALFIAYPFGFISFVFWYKIKNDHRPRNKFIPGLLLVGLILSLAVLIYMLIFE